MSHNLLMKISGCLAGINRHLHAISTHHDGSLFRKIMINCRGCGILGLRELSINHIPHPQWRSLFNWSHTTWVIYTGVINENTQHSLLVCGHNLSWSGFLLFVNFLNRQDAFKMWQLTSKKFMTVTTFLPLTIMQCLGWINGQPDTYCSSLWKTILSSCPFLVAKDKWGT